MNLETTPTIDLIEQMETIESQINILLDRHEKTRQELTRRIPPLESEECFKPLHITRKENDNEVNKTKIL